MSLTGIVAAMGTLAACGSSGSLLSSSVDYGSTRVIAPLDVPPDLTRPRVDDRFSVPGSQTLSDLQREGVVIPGQRGAIAGVAGAPNAAGASATARVLPVVDAVTMERDGAQRWLRIEQPADEVWPVVREFWQEAGFLIAAENPQAGILDTDWAENRAQISQGFLRNTLGGFLGTFYATAERDRYRARLERNPDGSTNLFVTHRGMVEVYTDQRDETTRWQPRPSDPSLEAEFLRLLTLRFGGEPSPGLQAQAAQAGQPGAAEAVAAEVAVNDRVRMTGEGEQRRLVTDESFDRAWRRVGLSLDRTGFTVEDRDRSIGTYFVRYIDPENPLQQEPGALARFFGAKPPEPALQAYRIVVAAVPESPSSTTVRVLPRDEKTAFTPESEATAQRMLGLIAEQMAR